MNLGGRAFSPQEGQVTLSGFSLERLLCRKNMHTSPTAASGQCLQIRSGQTVFLKE